MSRSISMKVVVASILLGSAILLAVFIWPSVKPQANPESSSEKTELISQAPGKQEVRPRVEALSFLPDPLRLLRDVEASRGLTPEGILEWSNAARGRVGLPPLVLDAQLTQAAVEKTEDMYSRGYFEHVSPIGVSPSDLVKKSGYQQIMSGENLALGNFRDDEHVVQAWMDSPGHRANILRKGFTEIGIATASGEFEGQKVWIAVQTFGTPTRLCPEPDEVLSESLTTNKEVLALGLAELSQLWSQIQNEDLPAQERAVLAVKFDQLNEARNNLVVISNEQVAAFNAQVQSFNECIAQFARSAS